MYFCQFLELDAATYVGHRGFSVEGALVQMEYMIFPGFRPSPTGGGHYQFWASRFRLLSSTGTGTV